ncbi:MAG: hypothetical protein D6743_07350, partial [Calditrichaeota bacterium]
MRLSSFGQLLCLGVFVFLKGTAVAGVAQTAAVRVGVVIDGAWEGNQRVLEMTQREILTLTEEEFDVRFPREKQIVADWTATGVHTAVTELLNDPDVDIVLAMG